MGGQVIDSPVRVVDNGVRSFIPPTFCFELRDEDENVVKVVSQIVLDREGSGAGARDFEALQILDREQSICVGCLSEYDAGPEARELGCRFSVTRCVPWTPRAKRH